jgi:dihydrofolate reductase
MRTIILFIAASLDGYIATPTEEVDWLFMDQDYNYSAFYDRIDTVVMGRKTYEKSLSFEPDPYPGKAVYVLTRSPQAESNPSVTYVRDGVEDWLESLRQAPGKDIWLVGGGQLIQMFLEQDWIDEFVISFIPIMLGTGILLFPPAQMPHRTLTLERSEAFDTGLVQLTYTRTR